MLYLTVHQIGVRGKSMNIQKDNARMIEEDKNIKLKDDFELLDIMLADSKNQPPLYQAGPYWISMAENAASEIKRCGIADFRNSTNHIGLSFSDSLNIDVRNGYTQGWKRRLVRRLTEIFPLSKIFDSQVKWTEVYANQNIIYIQEILNLNERTRNLLEKYIVPYSLLGKCLRKAVIDGNYYSTHYLAILEKHDNLASYINFNEASSIFEIGGGFGANVHLLLENYKNIKKVLYLDIPPNLYTGTQYLKAFYGKAVYDYRSLKHLDKIKFSADDNVEIFCIAPWQIENFISPIDIFMNTNSFIEMPNKVVENYTNKIVGFHGSMDTAIALTSYDGFDLNTTIDPNELPKFFPDRKFNDFEKNRFFDSTRKNYFFVSPGKFSF